mmetsp:Transcript_2822/g.11365  ORF Transcript_2822/g.11365 Transcript_2822/m.11365 type:complete len:412 (+) Transcript_2822:1280-2515(+)
MSSERPHDGLRAPRRRRRRPRRRVRPTMPAHGDGDVRVLPVPQDPAVRLCDCCGRKHPGLRRPHPGRAVPPRRGPGPPGRHGPLRAGPGQRHGAPQLEPRGRRCAQRPPGGARLCHGRSGSRCGRRGHSRGARRSGSDFGPRSGASVFRSRRSVCWRPRLPSPLRRPAAPPRPCRHGVLCLDHAVAVARFCRRRHVHRAPSPRTDPRLLLLLLLVVVVLLRRRRRGRHRTLAAQPQPPCLAAHHGRHRRPRSRPQGGRGFPRSPQPPGPRPRPDPSNLGPRGHDHPGHRHLWPCQDGPRPPLWPLLRPQDPPQGHCHPPQPAEERHLREGRPRRHSAPLPHPPHRSLPGRRLPLHGARARAGRRALRPPRPDGDPHALPLRLLRGLRPLRPQALARPPHPLPRPQAREPAH